MMPVCSWISAAWFLASLATLCKSAMVGGAEFIWEGVGNAGGSLTCAVILQDASSPSTLFAPGWALLLSGCSWCRAVK